MRSQNWILGTLFAGILCTAQGDAAAAAAAAKQAVFDVQHELAVKVPAGAKQVRIWFTRPQADPAQRVTNWKVDAPVAGRDTKDQDGNEYLYFELASPAAGEFKVTTAFTVARSEVSVAVDPAMTRAYSAQDLADKQKYLGPHANVVIDDKIKELSRTIVGDEKNPIAASRKIYDWVLANIDYWVKDPDHKKASPTGNTEYCLSSKTGNCTDFHSLYMSLSRAAGIPTRIIYGSFLKKELDGHDKDQSYHCWLEFFAPGIGWVPLDVAVADIFVGDFKLTDGNKGKVGLTTADGYSGTDLAKVNYYFGNLEERRITWSQGRDLTLEPKQTGGPVNAMAKAYVEIDGKESSEYTRKLTFKEKK
ncbi:MAG: transglutaminase domain-containing protein [Planctomycetes bacterium]|nr:transglutaminase domain-containing protein [Planctomycetota bacterium]